MSKDNVKALLTPAQIEGPFYPTRYNCQESANLRQKMPDSVQAKGKHIAVTGKVQNQNGEPLANMLIEIWQADDEGRYDHPGGNQHPEALDEHFSYWGQCVTDGEGRYTFHTIKPAAYCDEGDWRTPHIHFKFYQKRHECLLTTQLYFEGEALNEQDNHWGALSEDARKLLTVKPTQPTTQTEQNSKEWVCCFDVYLKTSHS